MISRRVRRGIVIGVTVWLGVAVVLMGLAAIELYRGKDALTNVQANASAESLTNGDVEDDLDTAATHLGRSHLMLDNPIVYPLRIVPVLGRQLASVSELSGAAATVSKTGVESIERARPLATDLDDKPRGAALREIGDITGSAADQLDDADFGPRDGLIGPLVDARNEVSKTTIELRNGLRRAEGASLGAASLFETDGRYLLVAANNGEMRSGSGMFLSVGELQTGNGRVELGQLRTIDQAVAPDGSVSWPPDIQNIWGWLGNQNDMRNLMLSPRFDASAPVAADIWQRSGGAPVDGVMMVDPAFLKAVIAATGPITEGDKTYTADNVLKQVMFEQYNGLAGLDSQNAARRDALSGVAGSAFGALNSGSWDAFRLARELGSAANGRHLMVWAKDSTKQEQWRQAGVAGEVPGDSMMVNMVNLGANKLDQFMDIDTKVARTTVRSGIEMSVTVNVRNNAPAEGAGYVLGPTTSPGSGGENFVRAQYRWVLALTVPGAAQGIRFDGDRRLVAGGVDGSTKVAGVDVDLKRGESATYVLRYTLPSTDRISVVRPSARIPSTTWTYEGQTWNDDQVRAINH